MMPGLSWPGLTFQRLRKRFSRHAIVLMYHRVTELDVDPWNLSVTPANFERHLAVIRRHASPIPLHDLAAARSRGDMPECSVAITFDDGYANNLHRAAPLLAKYELPATVFVAAGYTDSDAEFWWDELERLVLQPGTLPAELTLPVNGDLPTWPLGAAESYSEEEYHGDLAHTSCGRRTSARALFYYAVWQQLQPLEATQRRDLLGRLAEWSGRTAGLRETHRPMRAAELRALVESGLIWAGAHTMTHPLLPAHEPQVQREEIERSKLSLETMTGRTVPSFSYPFGNSTEATRAMVKAAGFESACTTVEECLWRGNAPFLLPRFEVRNWNESEFERRLLAWFSV